MGRYYISVPQIRQIQYSYEDGLDTIRMEAIHTTSGTVKQNTSFVNVEQEL